MNELKPCPFCGEKASASLTGKFAQCSNVSCELGHPEYFKLAEDWNTRPSEAILTKQVETLTKDLDEAEGAVKDLMDSADKNEAKVETLRGALEDSERVVSAASVLIEFVMVKYSVLNIDDLTCPHMKELAVSLIELEQQATK